MLFRYPSNYARFTVHDWRSLNNYMYFDVHEVTSRTDENCARWEYERGFGFSEREVLTSRCAALVMFNSCFFFLSIYAHDDGITGCTRIRTRSYTIKETVGVVTPAARSQ